MSSGSLARALAVATALSLSSACRSADHSSSPRPEVRGASEKRALRITEQELFARTDFARLPPSTRAFGANPYALLALPNGFGRFAFASVLKGDDALVFSDAEGAPLARLPAPPQPSALSLARNRYLFVSGELEPRVARYELTAQGASEAGSFEVPSAHSLRAVLVDDASLYLADFARDRLYVADLEPFVSARPSQSATAFLQLPTCRGPFRLLKSRRFVGVLCLFDHALVLYGRDETGLVETSRIRHDGPIWSAAMLEHDGALIVALGGVEDHPLVREHKVFGHVDSFVELWRVRDGAPPERIRSINSAELGVVTPKALELSAHGSELELTALGYASERALRVRFDPKRPESAAVGTEPSLPGCSALVRRGERQLCANPLLDAWVEFSASEPRVVPAQARLALEASPTERLGEALFYTTLMAPEASSAGALSRFTCETCHFEGGTDGRVHNSGRGGVFVSTRPLFGLFNNAPHFSRAKDPDLTSVSFNEFVVANAGSNPIDPFFPLDTARFPLLLRLGVAPGVLSPATLREALLRHLARSTYQENPLAVVRPEPRTFTQEERRGAELFRSECASCHAARLIARDERSEIPFERWESAVLSFEGPIVWARSNYEKVGVLPHVDAEGSRIPSLRRLFLKRPYFTNGTAATLSDVLRMARPGRGRAPFLHVAKAPEAERLTPSERAALESFLVLL